MSKSRRQSQSVGLSSPEATTSPEGFEPGANSEQASSIGGGGGGAGGGDLPPVLTAAAGSEDEVARAAFSGAPMALPYASEMESAFQQSFSHVTAYGGPEATAACESLGSQAFTKGNQIAFASETPPRDVVAHELAHVTQKGGGSAGVQQMSAEGGGAGGLEAEADAAATAVLAGETPVVASRAPQGQIQHWSGHEHRAMGNLGAIKAKGQGNFSLDDPDNTRDYLADSKDSSGVLARLDQQGSDALQVDTRGGNASISYGAASEFAGDYSENVQELSQEDDSHDTVGWDWGTMVLTATSNINHFYPLNNTEYETHHAQAVGLANQAFSAEGTVKTNLTRQAMLQEAFASHFLQDSFAAGHMAPRALDRVTQSSLGESLRGLERSKHWHDALNAPTEGLPTDVGNFRGDDTMNSADLSTISDATGDSLKEVTDILESGAGQSAITLPTPNASQILADPVYGPIWSAMLGDYAEDLAAANPDTNFETDGGSSSSTVIGSIQDNVFGGTPSLSVPNAEWNGSILVFNLHQDGSPAPAGTEVWIKWFDCDMGYDRLESGHEPNDVRDDDELIGGPVRVVLADTGIGSSRAAVDDTGDTYATLYSDARCLRPIGRSNVQGDDRGNVDKPMQASGFSWSGATLSFSVTRNDEPADGHQVTLRWYNEDSSNDRDAEGNLAQTILDTDSPVGAIEHLNVSGGAVSITARGDADNSGDTYAVVYLDRECTIPIGKSGVQP